MKVVLFQMSILLLWFLLDVSFGKIIFQPKNVNVLSLVSHFFQAVSNPEMDNVKVVNFGYDVAHPEEFQIVMKSLNEENHSKVTLALSDFDMTILNPWDRVFLLLLSTDHIKEACIFIDRIHVKKLHSIRAMILFNHVLASREEFLKLHEKPRAENFDEIIYAHPSVAPHTSGLSDKVLYSICLL